MIFFFNFFIKNIHFFLDDNGYTNVGQFYSLFWLYDVKLSYMTVTFVNIQFNKLCYRVFELENNERFVLCY